MLLFDSHSHLHFAQFDPDREAAIARARAAGLVTVIEIGASMESSRAAAALAQRHDFIYAAVGVHPHDATTVTPPSLDELRELAHCPKVVAVGEIGLDYYRDLSPRPTQRRAFEQQLALAAELGMPVVIHSRDALDDTLAILRAHVGAVRGVFHSYAGGPDRLDEVLTLGFSIGVSGPVTYPKSNALRAVAMQVPLERLLVETDCPYLTPQPHRGERNEPAYVRYVVERIAWLRGVKPEVIAAATTENARRLFGIREQEAGNRE